MVTLTGTDANSQQVRWSSASLGKQGKADLTADLGRIQAEPRMREEVRKRMHHGATVVTTNESSTAAHRSGRDFVVIDGIY